MRPETGEFDGAGEWEDSAPSHAVAAATDALSVLPDAAVPISDRMSTIMAASRLVMDGLSIAEAAAVLSLPYNQVWKALHDPRAAVVKHRLAADQGASDRLAAVQSRFRLDRAWEVVAASMESNDRWLRFQSASLVIAADRASKDKGPQEIIVRMEPEMVFDDQDLQDEPIYDADSTDSDGQERQEPV